MNTVLDDQSRHSELIKPYDAIFTRLFIDPLAVPLARWLAPRSWVTPNRITLVAAALAVAASVSFVVGWLRLAGALFILRFFFDCLDGKVARSQGSSSSRGAALDLGVDTLGISLCYAALSWYLVTSHGFPLEVVMVLLVALCFHHWVLSHRKALARQLGMGDGGAGGRVDLDVPGLRWWARLSERRLMSSVPWMVEVEIGVLGLFPLAGPSPVWWVSGLYAATAFYLAADAINSRRVWRLARIEDLKDTALSSPADDASI